MGSCCSWDMCICPATHMAAISNSDTGCCSQVVVVLCRVGMVWMCGRKGDVPIKGLVCVIIPSCILVGYQMCLPCGAMISVHRCLMLCVCLVLCAICGKCRGKRWCAPAAFGRSWVLGCHCTRCAEVCKHEPGRHPHSLQAEVVGPCWPHGEV